MNTAPRGGPDSEAAIEADRLVSRAFPDNLDRRSAQRRAYTALDTRVDVDLSNPNVGAERRHNDRRRFADAPAAPSAFGVFK